MQKIKSFLIISLVLIFIIINGWIYYIIQIINDNEKLLIEKTRAENELYTIKKSNIILKKTLEYKELKEKEVEQIVLSHEKTIRWLSAKENYFKYRLELNSNKINLLQNEVNNLKSKIPKKNLVWDYTNLKVPRQKAWENTCVLNSIKVIFKNNKNIDVDVYSYARMTNNPVGKYWQPWLLIEDNKTWNKFLEEADNKLFTNFRKLYLLWIEYKYTNLITDLEKKLTNKEYVLFTAPMYVFFPEEEKWFSEQNKLIYHSVAIIGIDYTNKKVLYTDSLTGTIRKLNFNEIFLNDKYIKFPILYFTYYPEF